MTATPSTTELRATVGSTGPRFGGLDGLRAIAVLLVIVYHLFPGVLQGGFIGVDVFFVISGFLITALLLREHARGGGIHLGRFWVRRARRLLPAIGLLVIVCGGFAWIVGGDVLIGLGVQVVGAATFSSNWLALASSQSYFDASAPELFRNLWSLAVEEQFYLLWPLLLLLLLRVPWRRLRVALLSAAATASAVGMALLASPSGDSTRAYYGTDTHSFGLALGAALAFAVGTAATGNGSAWPTMRRRGALFLQAAGAVAVLGVVAGAIVLRDDAVVTYRGGLALVAVLTAIAILAGIQPGSPVARLLDTRALAWVGDRSYGLYLWHWPVFVLVSAVVSEAATDAAARWIVGAAALVITVCAAQLSYVFVEQPVRTHGFRATSSAAWRAVAREPGRRGLVAATSAVAALSLVAATTAGIVSDPGAGAVERQIEAGMEAIEDAAPTPPSDEAAPGVEPVPAPIPGGEQITAIGDSVMLASAGGLQQVFPGIDIDASVSRQFSHAPELIRYRLATGSLRPIVLLGLGTNGPVNQAAITEVRELLGTDHQLVLVNVYAPRSWTDGVNGTLTSFAQQYRDVELANWRDSIQPQLRLLARDQIHPGDAGGLVYAAAVQDALQRLAELPPIVGPRDYGLAPLPT